jgi:TonB family protein
MNSAKHIYSSKFEIFLGVSLALHLALLGYWPLNSEQSNAGSSRSVVMVLASVAGNEATISTDPFSAIPTDQADPVPMQESFDITPEILEPNTNIQHIDPVAILEPQNIPPELIQANAVVQQISALSVEDSSVDMPEVTQPVTTIQASTPPPKPKIAKASKVVTKSKVVAKLESPTTPRDQKSLDSPIQPVTTKLATTPPGQSSQANPHSIQASLGQEQSIAGQENSNSEEKDLALLSAMLHEQIVHNRRYPVMAKRQRREGVATIRFDLFPDGDLLAVNVVQSSGYQMLDDAAIKAVKRVSPFRPASDYLTQAREFNVNVVFKLR